MTSTYNFSLYRYLIKQTGHIRIKEMITKRYNSWCSSQFSQLVPIYGEQWLKTVTLTYKDLSASQQVSNVFPHYFIICLPCVCYVFLKAWKNNNLMSIEYSKVLNLLNKDNTNYFIFFIHYGAATLSVRICVNFVNNTPSGIPISAK